MRFIEWVSNRRGEHMKGSADFNRWNETKYVLGSDGSATPRTVADARQHAVNNNWQDIVDAIDAETFEG